LNNFDTFIVFRTKKYFISKCDIFTPFWNSFR